MPPKTRSSGKAAKVTKKATKTPAKITTKTGKTTTRSSTRKPAPLKSALKKPSPSSSPTTPGTGYRGDTEDEISAATPSLRATTFGPNYSRWTRLGPNDRLAEEESTIRQLGRQGARVTWSHPREVQPESNDMTGVRRPATPGSRASSIAAVAGTPTSARPSTPRASSNANTPRSAPHSPFCWTDNRVLPSVKTEYGAIRRAIWQSHRKLIEIERELEHAEHVVLELEAEAEHYPPSRRGFGRRPVPTQEQALASATRSSGVPT